MCVYLYIYIVGINDQRGCDGRKRGKRSGGASKLESERILEAKKQKKKKLKKDF